jgi:hypothetical protein
MKTIHQLRKEGIKVRVSHMRFARPFDSDSLRFINVTKAAKKEKMFQYIDPKGGCTTIDITNKLGADFTAQANCSDLDRFDRKLGIRICLGRLEKQGAFA